MGLFSSKKVYTVNTTVTRLIEDKNILASPPISVVSSIIRSDNQVMETVVEGLVSGVGSKAHSFYNYGRTTYLYKTPALQAIAPETARSNTIIQTILPLAIGAVENTITYSIYAPLNAIHKGWVDLFEIYKYKSSNNSLIVVIAGVATTVYLVDMRHIISTATARVMDASALVHWGISPTAGATPTRVALSTRAATLPLNDPLAVGDSLLVTHERLVAGVVTQGTFSIPLIDDLDKDYFQVQYTDGTNTGYWLYLDKSGTYPLLDVIYTPNEPAFGSFFPFTYFRYNAIAEGAGSPSKTIPFDETAIAGRFLRIPSTIVPAVPESPGYATSKKMLKRINLDYDDLLSSINGNKDITSVQQAMMIWAVPASSTNSHEIRYLFDFFMKMKANGVVLNLIRDTRFTITVGVNFIDVVSYTGVISAVGKYSSSKSTITVSADYMAVDEGGTQYTVSSSRLAPVFYYRYQDTATTYIEVSAIDPVTQYHVWGGMTTVGDDVSPILLIPLDYSITNNYSVPFREILYARSLHLVFNSLIITKIKWYQTGFFKFLMVVIAIIIVVWTGVWLDFTTALAAAAAKGFVALAVFFLKMVGLSMLISFIAKQVIKLIGVKYAAVLAVIMVVAAIFGDIGAAGMFQFELLNANTLLMMANGLVSGIGDAIQLSILSLQKEMFDFNKFIAGELETIKKAADLLDGNNWLSPVVIFGETPDEFYDRSVHYGNIGILSLDAVSSYVDIALTLPRLAETLEGDSYV